MKDFHFPRRTDLGGWVPRIGMTDDEKRFQETRSTLIARLQDLGDEKGWLEFFNIYWRLIYNVARRAGLGHEDGQDIVQDTVVKVSRSIGDFDYHRQRGSFKNWLCVVTRSCIVDFQRRQMRQVPRQELPVDPDEVGDPMERIVDPRGNALEQIWDEEWRLNLLDVVLERVKTEVSERQFQIFHCHVVKEWSVREVCRALNVSAAQVYLAKHRVGAVFAQEMEGAKRLANEPGGIN